MQRLFVISKWLHKYVGLLLIAFLSWMSLSGVLMNHPELISSVRVPGWLVPPQYRVSDWSRAALGDLVFSPSEPDVAWAAGKPGVWVTRDGGDSFVRDMEGLPRSGYYHRTRDLALVEHDGEEWLLAACDGGLFLRGTREAAWRRVELGHARESVRRIVSAGDRLFVATPSAIYRSPLPPTPGSFEHVAIARDEPASRVTLVRLFFDVHYGKVWGLFGLLLFDVAGVILFFLCLSAFYTWYFPWKARRNRKSRLLTNPTSRRLFKTLFRYHLKLGIWIAAVLLVISGTGLFMRPPLLAAIADGSVPRAAYPGPLPDNPWDEKIQNLLFDPVAGTVVIQANDGLWVGDRELGRPFRRHTLDVPIFVMGATVFEPDGDAGYLVGSFSGLYRWDRASGSSVDVVTNAPVTGPAPLRPGEHMVTGTFRTPEGVRYVATFEQGLLRADTGRPDGRFAMPAELESGAMPLWSYLFEIHNGRFFKDLVGNWNILIIPIGSLLFLLLTLSGIYDWLHLKLTRRERVDESVGRTAG